MSISSATPVLRVFDMERAKNFYVKFLGFRIDWEHRFESHMPSYLQLSLDGCKIHLTEHEGDSAPGAALRIHVDKIDEFHDRLQSRRTDGVPDVEPMPWGTRDLTVEDPFGNRLTFAEEFCNCHYHDVPA